MHAVLQVEVIALELELEWSRDTPAEGPELSPVASRSWGMRTPSDRRKCGIDFVRGCGRVYSVLELGELHFA